MVGSWSFRLVHELEPVLATNVRWLSGYRHPRHGDLDLDAALHRVFAAGGALLAGVSQVADPLRGCRSCSICCGATGETVSRRRCPSQCCGEVPDGGVRRRRRSLIGGSRRHRDQSGAEPPLGFPTQAWIRRALRSHRWRCFTVWAPETCSLCGPRPPDQLDQHLPWGRVLVAVIDRSRWDQDRSRACVSKATHSRLSGCSGW